MKKSCDIFAQVNVNGEQQDSKLHQGLLALVAQTNNAYSATEEEREIVLKIYQKLISPSVQQAVNKLRERGFEIRTNDQNEYELTDILKYFNIVKMLNFSKFQGKILKEFGVIDDAGNQPTMEKSYFNYTTLEDICSKINNSPTYGTQVVATVEENEDFLKIRIVQRNKDSIKHAQQIDSNVNQRKDFNEFIKTSGINDNAIQMFYNQLSANGVQSKDIFDTTINNLIQLIMKAKGLAFEEKMSPAVYTFIYEQFKTNPLVIRLFNVAAGNEELRRNVLDDQYDAYVTFFAQSPVNIINAVAAKMLGDYIVYGTISKGAAPYADLIRRASTQVIEALKQYDENQLKIIHEPDILEYKNTLEELASDIDTELKADISALVGREKRLAEVKREILKNELRRYQIYVAKGSANEGQQLRLLQELMAKITATDEANAICAYCKAAWEQIQTLYERMDNLAKTDSLNYRVRFKSLREIRDTVYSFKNILDYINRFIEEDKNSIKPIITNDIVKNVDDSIKLLNRVNSSWSNQAKALYSKQMSEILGTNVFTINQTQLTLDEFINMNTTDINMADLWLNSMALTNNPLLKASDKIVKEHHGYARQRAIEMTHRLMEAARKLEAAGYKNQDFMFERDEEGQRTGDYIHFDSDAYKNLSEAQREFVDTIYEIKNEIDACLPPYCTKKYRTIKILKDVLERAKSAKDFKEGRQILAESIRDKYLVRSDDIDYGFYTSQLDFEKHEVQSLPIFYTKLREGESEEDVSMDVISTFSAYAAMAFEYNEMSKIIDMLEVGKSVLSDAQNPYKDEDNLLQKAVKKVTGKDEQENPVEDLDSQERARKTKNNTLERLNTFMEMQVYHRYIKDETVKNVKISKVADGLNALSSLNNMAFNGLAAWANVATGAWQMAFEAKSEQFFNFKDLVKADKEYAKYLDKFIAEMGTPVKTNKLSLLSELFDVSQDFDKDVNGLDYDKKWYQRVFGTSALFFMSNSGEHWMSHRTFFAVCFSTKELLTDSNGNKYHIHDAFNVVSRGDSSKFGADLEFKQGLIDPKTGKKIITKKELKERSEALKLKDMIVSLTDPRLLKEDEISEYQYVHRISKKVAGINHQMHGIYNKEDRAGAQQLAIGRLAFMYRKWIVPSIIKRYGKRQMNYDTGEEQEGYYRTAFNFTKLLIQDLRAAQFDWGARKNELTELQKANLRRARSEVVMFGSLSIILMVLNLLGLDDDEPRSDRSWIRNFAEYQLRRLQNEIGVLIPSVTMAREGLKIFEQPFAGVSTLEDAIRLVKILDPSSYEPIERGRYKGKPKVVKYVLESPLLPGNKTIYKLLNPEEQIGWLNKW